MISEVAMAEEFQVCSGNWWNSPRNLFGYSPCSWAVNGNLGWPSNCSNEPVMDMNNVAVISSDDSAGSASDGSCTTLQDVPKTHDQPRNISDGSWSTHDCWNQDFLHESARSEENYSQIMNYRQESWINPNNFSGDLSSNQFKQVNQDFSTQHQPLNSTANSIESCAATCGEISINFPLNSSSYSYTSSVMQNLLGQDNNSQRHVSSFLDDQEANYLSEPNYVMNSNELLLRSLPKSSSMLIQSSSQQPANHSPFSNNSCFWNATAPALRNDSSNFVPSTNSPILRSIHNIKNNIPNISTAKHREEVRDLASSVAKKQNSSGPAFKRPRIETPSVPLPTFKVRKEKLGDRITALQQLVSPFGKTDTASVLHEAVEYIKFLHDQVKVLNTPYLKIGSPPLHHQVGNKPNDREGLNQDLKSRGLCLVPISSTFPVAAETTSDFWTHTFGASFR